MGIVTLCRSSDGTGRMTLRFQVFFFFFFFSLLSLVSSLTARLCAHAVPFCMDSRVDYIRVVRNHLFDFVARLTDVFCLVLFYVVQRRKQHKQTPPASLRRGMVHV